jgi:hypothetical protein
VCPSEAGREPRVGRPGFPLAAYSRIPALSGWSPAAPCTSPVHARGEHRSIHIAPDPFIQSGLAREHSALKGAFTGSWPPELIRLWRGSPTPGALGSL